MKARTVALVGLLAVAFPLLVWFLVHRADSDARADHSPEHTRPADERAATRGPGTGLETPAGSSSLETTDAPDGTRRSVVATAPEVEPRTWPAEETRWLDVRSVAPEGTPFDERASIVALAANADYDSVYGKSGPVVAMRSGRDPMTMGGVLAATELDEQGVAKLALPPDVEEAWLAVSGNYLYSRTLRKVVVAEQSGAVTLKPTLGARISGQLKAPASDRTADVAGVQVALDWSTASSFQLGSASAEDLDVEALTDAEGRFEFRGVPVGKPQLLSTRESPLARSFHEDLEPKPGEHVRVELGLLVGGTVRGRVVDEQGEPIAGAEVDALGREFFGNPTDRLRKSESDDDGRFELAGVTPGKVWLRLEHEDYQELLADSFQLADREARDHGDVVLTQGLAVAGTVVFPDGTPAIGARVSVDPDLSNNISGSPVDPRAYIGARSDDEADEAGSFKITGLGSGPWGVKAEIDVEASDSDRALGLWTAMRAPVKAPSGELVLTLDEPVNLSGRVVDSKDQPVAAFSILAERAGSQWYMPPSETVDETFESEDGSFVLTGLRSGKWTFSASGEAFARSAELELEMPGEEEPTFVLLRPVVLAGKVVDPDGRPLSGAQVSKELEGTEVFEAMQGRSDWPEASSDEDGNFTLGGLAPGAGSVLAKKDGFAPSAAVAYELAEGEQQLDLVLTMRRGGTISGEVYAADGDRASNCLVIVQMPTMEERRIINTDAKGTFEEAGLKPGKWQVQAFPGIASLNGENGETLDQAAFIKVLKMTTVELADETAEHVVLGAPPADPVRVFGRVTLDREPLEGLMVSFVAAGGAGLDLLKIESTGSDGTFDLQLDEPGEYLVTIQTTASPGNQNSIEFRRTVPKGEDCELNFELPLGRVSGRVVGPNGKPAPNTRVTLNMQNGLVFGTVFGGQYNETMTDERGEYEILFLRPGSYTVAAGGSFLGGMFGDGTVLGRIVKSVEVEEGESIRGLDFKLEAPGKIQGSVRDAAGKPTADASIFLRDEEGRLVELFSLNRTNASGSFEYPGLAPGEYTLTARTSTLSSSTAVPVRVRSGETTEAKVVLEPGTLLLVTLIDKSGEDVPSTVSVLDEGNRQMNGMLGLTELMELYGGGLDDTVQKIGPLPPGTYTVSAFSRDGRSTSRSVDLSGQPERKLKLRLR